MTRELGLARRSDRAPRTGGGLRRRRRAVRRRRSPALHRARSARLGRLLRRLRRGPGHRGAARLLELLDRRSVVLLTGRPMRVQPQTLAWLERYGLRWDLLVMRARGDYSQVTGSNADGRWTTCATRVRPAAGLRGRPQQLRHVPRPRACRASTSTRGTTSSGTPPVRRTSPRCRRTGQQPRGRQHQHRAASTGGRPTARRG